MSAINSTMRVLTSTQTRGNLILRHPLLTLVALIYVFEWIVLVPQALESQGLLPFKIPPLLAFAVGWGPALAAIIVTAAMDGWTGVKDLFRRFLIVRVGAAWYLIALFGLAVVILAGAGLSALLGVATPVIPASKVPLPTVAIAFAVTMLLGLFINTEEVAWRGVMLPRLQAKHSALVATLIIAVPEGLSHLPYFFNRSITFYQTVGVVAFLLFSFVMTVAYTWLFNSTRGSLLIVTLLHASQNTWANLLSDNQAAPFYLTVGLLAIVAVALVIIYGAQNLSRRPRVGITLPSMQHQPAVRRGRFSAG